MEQNFPQLEESCDAINFVRANCWGKPIHVKTCIFNITTGHYSSTVKLNYLYIVNTTANGNSEGCVLYLELSFKQSFLVVWNNLPGYTRIIFSIEMSYHFDRTKGWQIKPPGDLNFSTVEVQLNIEKAGWRKVVSVIPSSRVQHRRLHLRMLLVSFLCCRNRWTHTPFS